MLMGEARHNKIEKNLNTIALLVFTAIALSWGQSFEAPTIGLDPGWREALVQATDQGLGFGKDLIFTFGPYHQLYTNAISENLYPFAIGRLVYGIAWGAATISFARLSTPAAGWLLAVFMALCGSLSDDAPFYALQLAFLLIAASDLKRREMPLIALVYAGIITTIFCKLSFAVSAGPIFIFAAFLLAIKFTPTLKQGALAIAVAIGIPLMIWTASGQSIMNLLHYFFGPNLSIVLGYSSAMATDDPAAAWQIPAFWIGAISIIALIWRAVHFRLKNKFSAALISSASLFLFWTTFKAGMVRHDGHASIAGLSMASFAVLTIIFSIKTKADVAIYISAAGPLVLGLGITSQYFSPIRSYLDEWLKKKLQNAYLFAKILPSTRARQKLQDIRQEGFDDIKKDAEDLSLIPKDESTDSMPWDITDIPANGLRYRPRPIIQSYSAYTPSLQELNRNHFLGKQAPMYLALHAQSIDGRNPPDLDYPSLEAISSKYQIIGNSSKGSLILKHNSANKALARILKWREARLELLGDEGQGANPLRERWSQLPQQLAEGSRFSLELKPNFWRRLQTIAFKPSPLMMAVKFDDGQIHTYRIFETSSRKIPLYPFVKNNTSLKIALAALQGSPVTKQDMGPKPIAIRFVGSFSGQGLQSGRLIIEQPEFQ